jgi:hypothetical protein
MDYLFEHGKNPRSQFLWHTAPTSQIDYYDPSQKYIN